MKAASHPLPVSVERHTAFLEVEESRQSRATELVGDCGADQHIKSRQPGGFRNGQLRILNQNGGLTSDQGAKQCFLVREILVERSDTDTRPLGNSIRREAVVPVLLQNASRRLNDDIYRFLRASL